MDFRRLFDIFPYQQVRFPSKTALVHKQGIQWEAYSTAACLAEIDRVSAGLLELGVKRGEAIGIMTRQGSPEWNFLDFGMQQIGVIPVPIHAVVTQRELVHILKDAAIQYCIVANRELYERVRQAKTEAVQLKEMFTLKKLPDLPHWRELSREPMPRHLAELTGLKAAIHEDDLATIIYTSGTTDTPKGVRLSHKNIVSNIKAILPLIPLSPSKRVMSALPLSYSFERTVTYAYMAAGVSLHYAESLDTIVENAREIKPHYFTSVPHFLEQFYKNILLQAQQKNRLKRKLVYWAVGVGERYTEKKNISLAHWMKWHLADLFVYRAWRRALGRRTEGIIVGGARLQARLARLFSAAGLEIREGYGLTETAPILTVNRFDNGSLRFGTVGVPIPGVELKIEGVKGQTAGEILTKGSNVMLAYHRNEAATQATFTKDQWLRTGDIGYWAAGGFLKVLGKKKHLLQTPRGRPAVPEHLENKLNAFTYIQQSLVLGDGHPYLAALIVPDFTQLQQWSHKQGIHWTAPQFMITNIGVQRLFRQIVEVFNEQVASHERIEKFQLLPKTWSLEAGELTPGFKLRRKVILEKYKAEVETLFA